MASKDAYEGVKRSFNPDAFTWTRINGNLRENGARIDNRQIYLPKHLAEILSEHLIVGDDGYARVEIGYTEKSIAIRPIPPGRVGFKVVEKFNHSSKGYVICMASVVKDAGWKLPAAAYLEWDEEHKMLAGIVEEGKKYKEDKK